MMRVFIKSLTVILFLNISLFAENISSFDIKGMTLNDSYNTILKKLPCSPEKYIHKTESGKVSGYQLYCANTYDVSFNRYKKVESIIRWKKFDIQPNFKKIRQQVIKKYGKPTIQAEMYPGSNNPNRGFINKMCWGIGCDLKQEQDSSVATGTSIEINWIKKGFTVTYRKWSESNNDTGTLSFWLQDTQLKNENNNWEKKENKGYRQKKLENEKDAVDL